MKLTEESPSDKSDEGLKYLEHYFPCPSNQRDCLNEIAQAAWRFAESLEEYEPDYIQESIRIHSGADSEDPAYLIVDKLTVYCEVDTSIHEDIGAFLNGCSHFLDAFFRQREKVVALIEHDFALHTVVQVITIIEEVVAKLDDILEQYAADLCYAMYEGAWEVLEKKHGKNAIKHFKKCSELTTKEYEYAFEEITDFMNYINQARFSFSLNKLARQLMIFCELKIPDPEVAGGGRTEADEPKILTLIRFMQRYCERQSLHLLKCRRKSLNDADFRESIALPESAKGWRTGQAKYYKVNDLKEKWPDFCEVLPNLPPLKQS